MNIGTQRLRDRGTGETFSAPGLCWMRRLKGTVSLCVATSAARFVNTGRTLPRLRSSVLWTVDPRSQAACASSLIGDLRLAELKS